MWIFIFSAVALAAAVAPAPPVVEFPGSINAVPAPGGAGGRIFYRQHLARDQAQSSPVFFDDGRGHVQRLSTLVRSMEVGWSSDGRRAFLQNNWGSDIADCYALTRTSAGIHGLSLLKLIQHTKGHPRGGELPFHAHYYVQCESWNEQQQINGNVSGRTDATPAHDFSHAFTYDPRFRKIIWIN